MSNETEELVHSIRTAWERGDYGPAELVHPEIEYVHADRPAPGSWTGPRGMAEGWAEFLSAWESFRFEAARSGWSSARHGSVAR